MKKLIFILGCFAILLILSSGKTIRDFGGCIQTGLDNGDTLYNPKQGEYPWWRVDTPYVTIHYNSKIHYTIRYDSISGMDNAAQLGRYLAWIFFNKNTYKEFGYDSTEVVSIRYWADSTKTVFLNADSLQLNADGNIYRFIPITDTTDL
jgi:hypothetical protein